MIEIKGTKGNAILYSCGCGIEGRCLVKPLSNGPCVVNIKCPLCNAMTQVKLTQSEVMDKELSWACILKNEVVEYKIVRN
jgi:hypothetical protein